MGWADPGEAAWRTVQGPERPDSEPWKFWKADGSRGLVGLHLPKSTSPDVASRPETSVRPK